MVTVSLQPFALRKIVLLIAALVWLTSAVVFADPVFMNAQTARLAHKSAPSVARTVATYSGSEVTRGNVIEQSSIAPAEGPMVFSVSLDQLETWNEFTRRPLAGEAQPTFWPISLTR